MLPSVYRSKRLTELNKYKEYIILINKFINKQVNIK